MDLCSNVTLADVTVHTGINMTSDNTTARNLLIEDPEGLFGSMVHIMMFCSHCDLDSCWIRCEGTENFAGIEIHILNAHENITIRENTIMGCDPGVKFGFHDEGSPVFTGNTIMGNTRGVEIQDDSRSEAKWENNIITGNDVGVWIDPATVAIQDFGGGAEGSVGGNLLSCNDTFDVQNGADFVLPAQSCMWDHDPPRTPDSDPAGNDIAGDVDFTGNILAPTPCNGEPAAYTPPCTPDGIWHSADGHAVFGCPEHGDWGALGGWHPDTGHTWLDEFNGAHDAYMDSSLNDMVLYAPGGPLLTSADATGQKDAMSINFFGTGADFGLGPPYDFWMVDTSANIDVHRGGYMSGGTIDYFIIPSASLRFGRYIHGSSRFAAADTDNNMMYLVDDADGNVAHQWSTTYPVFRLAAAGNILVYTTNEGVYGGDAANSALFVYNADTGVQLDNITVDGGDFWGVDAILDDATGDVLFAAGTGSDGYVLGRVDNTGSTCHLGYEVMTIVSDVDFISITSAVVNSRTGPTDISVFTLNPSEVACTIE